MRKALQTLEAVFAPLIEHKGEREETWGKKGYKEIERLNDLNLTL